MVLLFHKVKRAESLFHYTQNAFNGIMTLLRGKGFTQCKHKGSEWRTALAQDAYPWVNLIALGEDQTVWTLYGIHNVAGSRFLIGPDGTILKINPTPEEVELAILENQ